MPPDSGRLICRTSVFRSTSMRLCAGNFFAELLSREADPCWKQDFNFNNQKSSLLYLGDLPRKGFG